MKNDVTVILASASPRRAELMRQIGTEPVILPADVDENIDEKDPAQLVRMLAERKCVHTLDKILSEEKYRNQDVLILAADTIVCIQDQILGKPADEDEAYSMLRNLSGKAHEVLTGVCIAAVKNDRQIDRQSFVETTKVHVCELSDQEIREYIATGEPMDKAGAYGIQGEFGKFVSGIEGNYANVVGLPVSAVYQTMKGMLHELQ